MSKDTLFTSGQGVAGASSDFERAAFPDITKPATTNDLAGYSTVGSSINPFGDVFVDSNSVRVGGIQRDLYFKDIQLVTDPANNLGGKPTYRVIFTEDFPQVAVYVAGRVVKEMIDGRMALGLLDQNDTAMAVGIFDQACFMVRPVSAATATLNYYIDGSYTNAKAYQGLGTAAENVPIEKFYVAALGAGAGSGNTSIHNHRISANQGGLLWISGLSVSFAAANAVSRFPGVTFNDKTQVTTVDLSVSTVPAPGILGAAAIATESALGVLGVTLNPIPFCSATATGSTGTNQVVVATGFGASFPVGSGILYNNGSSAYVGQVMVRSTDTLTVGPTLPFALSGSLYTNGWAGVTVPIGYSNYVLSRELDFTSMNYGYNSPGIATNGNSAIISQGATFGFKFYAVDQYCAAWGQHMGWTNISLGLSTTILDVTNDQLQGFYFLKPGAAALRIEGRFNAIEMETVGASAGAICSYTCAVNGNVAYSISEGQTGAVVRTLVSGLGMGWNTVEVSPGSSMGTVCLRKIRMYDFTDNVGISFGVLASWNIGQSAMLNSDSYTAISLGWNARYYADQLHLAGTWVRSDWGNFVGAHRYLTSTAADALNFTFYGNRFAIIGTNGAAASLLIDGTAFGTAGSVFNTPISVPGGAVDYHTVSLVNKSGTMMIEAVCV